MLRKWVSRTGRASIAWFVSVAMTAVVTVVLVAFAWYFYQA